MGAILGLLVFAICVIGAAGGVALAFGAGNVVKRLSGLALAHISAAILLVALDASALALIVLAALAAQCVFGAALAARIAEIYGAVETAALDGADAADETPPRGDEIR